MHIEGLISDLAFLLLLGAGVTVLFKWIKQPVVLGYIVAGFLASPNFEYLPSVTTEENIHFWAEIGIVVLLFSLGLEFSFKKLVNSGGSAVVTALIIVAGMMACGYAIGYLLGFNMINSLFLGGMLCMSSTTIIIKAFTDMGLRQQKFASLVLAVLIVEDLFAVVMMVVLSSIAVNNSVEGADLLMSVAKLVFFLVIWFLVGVYVLPSLFNRIRSFLNSETLLVVSMGLCLGMAVFSVYCGFSMALGAFVMGSILAGTSYAERIEHVVMPVKDLFGSVFFISVGMMVQPAILVEYWGPILILASVVIVGMICFGTFGMLVTGQTLKVAMRSGFSLTQIGEFAFIIATLGMSLGVLVPTLYPIVVAVSVITTFTTPYFIKLSIPAYNFVERHLPTRLQFLITRYQKEATTEAATGHIWRRMIKRYALSTLLYTVILIGIELVSRQWFKPWLDQVIPAWSSLLCALLTLGAMSPFLFGLLWTGFRRSIHRDARIPRLVIMLFRWIIAIALVLHVVSSAYTARTGIYVAVTVVLLAILLGSRSLRERMNMIESKFIANLNERELRRSGRNNQVVSDLHKAYMTVGDGCPFAGERLINSNPRLRYGVNIVSIQRGPQLIAIPGADERLYPGDVIGVIGTDDELQAMLPDVEATKPHSNQAAPAVELSSLLIHDASPLAGKTIRQSRLRNDYDALVVAVQRNDSYIETTADLVLTSGDILWLVGDPNRLQPLR